MPSLFSIGEGKEREQEEREEARRRGEKEKGKEKKNDILRGRTLSENFHISGISGGVSRSREGEGGAGNWHGSGLERESREMERRREEGRPRREEGRPTTPPLTPGTGLCLHKRIWRKQLADRALKHR